MTGILLCEVFGELSHKTRLPGAWPRALISLPPQFLISQRMPSTRVYYVLLAAQPLPRCPDCEDCECVRPRPAAGAGWTGWPDGSSAQYYIVLCRVDAKPCCVGSRWRQNNKVCVGKEPGSKPDMAPFVDAMGTSGGSTRSSPIPFMRPGTFIMLPWWWHGATEGCTTRFGRTSRRLAGHAGCYQIASGPSWCIPHRAKYYV